MLTKGDNLYMIKTSTDKNLHFNNVSSRNISIDAIKFLAIIGVLLIHNCNYYYPINSTSWLTNIFYGSILRCAVPLFLMCSGVLLLNPKKELTFKLLFTKYIPRLVIAMIFWAFFYKFTDLYFQNALSYENILNSVKEVFTLDHKFHMYYMHIIILVYLLLPITRILIKNMTKNELLYTISIWVLVGIIFPTLISLNIFPSFKYLLELYYLKMAYSAIGYCILGYFINKYKIKNSICLVCSIIGFFIIFFGTVILSKMYNTLYTELLNGFSIGVFLLAIGIFGLIINISDFGIFNKILIYISKASFCIYLVHVVFLNFVNINILLPQIIYIPIKVMLNLILSIAVYFLLSKIPIVKKYII